MKDRVSQAAGLQLIATAKSDRNKIASIMKTRELRSIKGRRDFGTRPMYHYLPISLHL